LDSGIEFQGFSKFGSWDSAGWRYEPAAVGICAKLLIMRHLPIVDFAGRVVLLTEPATSSIRS